MLTKIFRTNSLTGLFITDLVAIRHLTGFTGTTACLLVTPLHLFLLTDFRYLIQAQKETKNVTVVDTKEGITKIIERLLATNRKKIRLGLFAADTTLARYTELQKQLSKATLIPIHEDSAYLRTIKNRPEIEFLKEALLINRHAFKKVLPEIKPGRTEFEIRRRLETLLLTYGAERIGFDTIVASGVRGALPHGVASAKLIKRGELLTIDFGGVYHGYHADETVTLSLGTPTIKQKTVYQIVYDAQRFALEAVRPGVRASKLDQIARDYIETKGYGKYFGHALGHGVGLAVHERPILSLHSKDTIEVDSVFTIEPGIYIPRWGGVRLEDLVRCTATGPELISKIKKKELFVIA